MCVRGGRGAESVSFNNESFGDLSEVRYHVRDVTLGDVMFCGGVKHLLKHLRWCCWWIGCDVDREGRNQRRQFKFHFGGQFKYFYQMVNAK